MANWLENQYVVLTGASGGIGKELCKILIRKYRAKVIGIGRSEDKMQALKNELGELSPSFSYKLFDVGDKNNWIGFRDELEKDGIRPVLLVNNAGAFPAFRKACNTPSETAERIIRTNYLSIVYAVETISPLLDGNGKYKPSIVNICSSVALCSIAGAAAYAASKGAVKGFSEALQLEEKGKKHIGIIYPGTAATELFREDANMKNSALDKIAMPADKMARKVARAIRRRKKRAVLGWDAKLMNFMAKIAPVKGVAFICWIMRISRSKVFKEVFDYNKAPEKK